MNWLYWPHKDAAAPARAFCFPYAGSGVSAYAGWAARLRPTLDLCVVVPPGREIRYRELPLADMKLLAGQAAAAILPHLDRPFVLFGHSFGALFAFEVARALRRMQARMPQIIFVSAAPAPQCPWPHQNLHLLADEAFVAGLGELYGGISPLILEDPDLRSIVLPALRADVTAVETYTYIGEEPMDCPISAFGGRHDTAVRSTLLHEWKQQTSGEFRVREMAGDHFYIRSERDEMIRFVLADMAELAR